MENTKKSGGGFKAFLKFTPIFLLAYLMIGEISIGGMTFSGAGFDVLTAAPLSAFYAAIIAFITEGVRPTESIDVAVENVKGIQLVFFILMMAYAMANAFMETGVGAALVNIALSLGVTGRTVAMVGFIVTCLLSVATGTSWGTFAACAPIFLWLNDIVDGNLLLTAGAIAGGSCFGDNIGLISDTTVVSSGIQGVEVVDRIRYQGVWSVGTAVVAAIIFYLAGRSLPNVSATGAEAIAAISPETFEFLEAERPSAVALLNQIADGVSYIMALPMILVIAFAFMGVPTLMCLGLGLVSSLILGSFVGTVPSLRYFLESIMEAGFADAGGWVIVMMMWISGFGGIMNRMRAFEPLSNFLLNISKSIRQLMFWNGVLCLLGNALLADEMAQIVTIGPILKENTNNNIEGSDESMYRLALRNATFSDAMGVFGSQLIPWHVYLSYYIGMAGSVYPLHQFSAGDFISHNYMAWVAVGSMLILTITGWDRFIPMFSMPNEPEVELKKAE
ncbi:MAG: Na+/H+ antiporter NhaC family protein [Tissierellia bacterium]|nr:Na+/H+ antiporter NhaC family protein [Tissierellia bacterium]